MFEMLWAWGSALLGGGSKKRRIPDAPREDNESSKKAKIDEETSPLERRAYATDAEYWLYGCKSKEQAKLLLERGAEINARDTEGGTPLHYAISSNRSMEYVTFLVDLGAEINARDENGDTPLYRAILWNVSMKWVTFLGRSRRGR